MPEQQNIEYKESWRDEYLKWICGFANANGGQIFIGIDDKGNVTGLAEYKRLMDDIPNKIANNLGLVVDVNLHDKNGQKYIEIAVPPSDAPISYHGAYHIRSGSTKQELKGTSLQNWLLKKVGKKWEDTIVPGVTINDLDDSAIKAFLNKAILGNRIPEGAEKETIETLLSNLNLMIDGQLTNACVLIFGKRPSLVSNTSSVKIGRFGKDPHDLLFQDVIDSHLFDMADKVMEMLKSKYLTRPITYQGLERIENLEYPEAALREAILNAIIHKDYSSTFTFLRVYDDRLEIWNPGELPEQLTIESLKTNHLSFPRNLNIANVFFKAGYVETWGRGTTKIISSCLQAKLPEPILEEVQGGLRVVFKKDLINQEHLQTLGISQRQIDAVLYVKEKGQITNSEYQALTKVSKSSSATDLQQLVDKKVLSRIGNTGRSTKYVLYKD